MKKYNSISIAVLLFHFVLIVKGQNKFYIDMGFLMGGVLEPSVKDAICNNNGSLRVGLSIHPEILISQKYSMGLQLQTAGQIIPTTSCTVYNPQAMTETILSNNRPSHSILLTNDILVFKKNDLLLQIGLAPGLNIYTYGYITEEVQKIHQQDFVFSPGIKLRKNKYFFQLNTILGGTTPSFQVTEASGKQIELLRGVRSDQIYLSLGLRIH